MDRAETVLAFTVPARHPSFVDHFPGHPIVPGALLIQWLCQRVEARLAGRQVTGVKSMKFLATLSPGDACSLSLDVQTSTGHCKLRLQRDGELVCQGVLLFDGDQP